MRNSYYHLSQEYEMKKAAMALEARQWRLAKLARKQQRPIGWLALRRLGHTLIVVGTALEKIDPPEGGLQIQSEPPLC